MIELKHEGVWRWLLLPSIVYLLAYFAVVADFYGGQSRDLSFFAIGSSGVQHSARHSSLGAQKPRMPAGNPGPAPPLWPRRRPSAAKDVSVPATSTTSRRVGLGTQAFVLLALNVGILATALRSLRPGQEAGRHPRLPPLPCGGSAPSLPMRAPELQRSGYSLWPTSRSETLVAMAAVMDGSAGSVQLLERPTPATLAWENPGALHHSTVEPNRTPAASLLQSSGSDAEATSTPIVARLARAAARDRGGWAPAPAPAPAAGVQPWTSHGRPSELRAFQGGHLMGGERRVTPPPLLCPLLMTPEPPAPRPHHRLADAATPIRWAPAPLAAYPVAAVPESVAPRVQPAPGPPPQYSAALLPPKPAPRPRGRPRKVDAPLPGVGSTAPQPPNPAPPPSGPPQRARGEDFAPNSPPVFVDSPASPSPAYAWGPSPPSAPAPSSPSPPFVASSLPHSAPAVAVGETVPAAPYLGSDMMPMGQPDAKPRPRGRPRKVTVPSLLAGLAPPPPSPPQPQAVAAAPPPAAPQSAPRPAPAPAAVAETPSHTFPMYAPVRDPSRGPPPAPATSPLPLFPPRNVAMPPTPAGTSTEAVAALVEAASSKATPHGPSPGADTAPTVNIASSLVLSAVGIPEERAPPPPPSSPADEPLATDPSAAETTPSPGVPGTAPLDEASPPATPPHNVLPGKSDVGLAEDGGLESDGPLSAEDLDRMNDAPRETLVFPPLSPEEEAEVRQREETLRQEVTVVRDREAARRAVAALMAHPEVYHACDTEVADIDVKKVGPVGHGRVICISIYSGPNVDFGEGPGKVLWVDNLDAAEGVLQEFKAWFEDPAYKKVWHNYGFDRHVLFNEGIDCRGLGGDTLHMARIWDSSRERAGNGKGYSLEALSEELLARKKESMKTLFGEYKKRKDGTPGKLVELPPLRNLQRHQRTLWRWIDYSSYDAKGTYLLREQLEARLRAMQWMDGCSGKQLGNMMDFYSLYMVRFAECLTDMERTGIHVDQQYLRRAEELARSDMARAELFFRDWVDRKLGEVNGQRVAYTMNPGSAPQIQTLLFGGAPRKGGGDNLPRTRTFTVEVEDAADGGAAGALPADEDIYALLGCEQLRAELRRRQLPAAGKKAEMADRLRAVDPTGRDLPADLLERVRRPRKAQRKRDVTITSLGLEPRAFAAKGTPAVDAAALRELAGKPNADPPKWGRAYEHFHAGEEGAHACKALDSLLSIGTIGSCLSNFLLPLQVLADQNSRIHGSLNLNTETGRLSSRKPNLQNQPALEKDQYKIRQAFRAPEGHTLVVADYGQLELRILAHMTNCVSMIQAFESGVDFHSATAVDMFPEVRQAIDAGEVLMEWHGEGPSPKPLVKDKFGAFRRKAKTLNFSIVYGKTVNGLAKDWGVTEDDARDLLDKWYKARPEVREWQNNTIEYAHKFKMSRTLMGRYRRLPEIDGPSRPMRRHLERAAINTPIQGGAADVVIMAMLKVHESPRLRELGYRMVLQVHDEIIVEGPEEHAQAALEEVRHCMEEPWDHRGLGPLRVKLEVDAKFARSWYEAK